MKYKYRIKKRTGPFPYTTIVELSDNEYIWELDVSFTLWGAKRKIKKLIKKLELRDNVINKGEITT